VFCIKGRLVTPTNVLDGNVVVEDGRIVEVSQNVPGRCKIYDFGKLLVVPGFIDIHMHGLEEYVMFEAADITASASKQLKYGTTGFVPTAASLSQQRYIQFGENVRRAQQRTNNKAATVIGAQFEGPFINPQRKGGMDAALLRPVSLQECQQYIDQSGDILKIMTLSPELPGSDEVIKLLRSNNIIASLGHSLATEQDVNRAIDCGLNHVCHLFNTFMRVSEIQSGIWPQSLVENILRRGVLNCEVICDMHHVSAEYIKFAARLLGPDRFIAMTDSFPNAGFEDGRYRTIDGREFSIADGAARLISDGTLIGSIITMNRAFANLVEKCGVGPVDAVKFTSTNPARVMGTAGRVGSIEVGKYADIAVLDDNYECIATFIKGQLLYER